MSTFLNKKRKGVLRKSKATKNTVKIVYWKKENGFWLGYLQDYPDYWTQGTSFEELKENLRDIYRDVTSGEIPEIRKVEEIEV
jgi:predicted RNase H-like HicB family nuclease